MIFAAVLFDIKHPFLSVSGMLLLAFAGNVSPIFVALVKETNEEHRFGTVLSINNSFAYAVTAVFGSILGRLMDCYAPQVINNVSVYGRNSYLLVFGVLLLLIAISVIFSLFLKESYGKNIADKVR